MPPPSCTGFGGLQDRLHRRAIDGLPSKAPFRSTTCSHSQPCVLEGLGLGGGIGVEDRRLVHLAQQEAHALAVFQVDGGVKRIMVRAPICRKLAIRARPSVWLFSGWNCVPNMLPRATAAVTGPP
jgi:hypothetical protein